jgi:D-alanine transaminase
MQEIAFYNGEFLNSTDAMTSVEDRGNTFGDGVYDAISCFNGVALNLNEHVERFFNSMAAIDIHSPYKPDEVKDIINKALGEAGFKQAMVYFQITRGSVPRAHAYPDGMVGNFYLVVREKYSYESERKNGCKIISMPDDRWRRCDIKTLNLLPNVMAAKKAKQSGCIEALLVRDGHAAECTACNAWRVKDGVVYTEPLSPLILRGISRTRLIDEIAPSVGIKVVQQHSSLQDYYDADEVFITSCTKLVLPVTQVDDVVIGDNHPIADLLFNAYADLAQTVCGPIDKEKI